MASKNKQNRQDEQSSSLIFGRKNYQYMFLGIALIFVGYILMSGGGTTNPNVWNPAIFNFRRIRLAPMLILLGMLVEVYAIMRKPE